mmetsp:Transcript_72956/g.145053  ORF Transcript_72956/g.145053 Transcript_72956/m.145053 type:complete len:201 (-) Transcript_72956:907-1509(-)
MKGLRSLFGLMQRIKWPPHFWSVESRRSISSRNLKARLRPPGAGCSKSCLMNGVFCRDSWHVCMRLRSVLSSGSAFFSAKPCVQYGTSAPKCAMRKLTLYFSPRMVTSGILRFVSPGPSRGMKPADLLSLSRILASSLSSREPPVMRAWARSDCRVSSSRIESKHWLRSSREPKPALPGTWITSPSTILRVGAMSRMAFR